MSHLFRDLKVGGLYVAACPNKLWSDDGIDLLADIPVGACFLVIEPVPSGWDAGFDRRRVYRVLIDGTVGTLLVREGDVLPVEEA